MEVITDLDSICSDCGFFNSGSHVNNGYCCSHKECGDGEFVNKNDDVIDFWELEKLIVKSFTKRKISCNRRLAKKFVKKMRAMSFDEKKEKAKSLGFKYIGVCFSFTCPIAYEVSYDSIPNYINGKEYDYIKSEDEMPWGWGDDLMAIDKDLADELNIKY